ncbi:cytochrome c551 [Bacillus thermophilus]|uniref:Cytochrome c551 n=1 Tax=Siminovitchia thermophila TaxID=1245522 RepID=A0ABS2R491_9BACI|nr:cytochrome c [Siminovitchia thermophila]MBM7714210.1 cytochrome c551 [Siminovitchia thermophila]ONK23375.1 cytochrome C551 [Bacillus sp. VT-16-64]
MKRKMMAFIAGAGLVVGLAACGGGGDNDKKDGGETTSAGAEKIYAQNCASCHGENLEGVSGPKLADVGSRLSKDDILKTIENGAAGMPPNIISGDDADKVATWLAEKK